MENLVLITGASGYLGGRIVRFLTSSGWSVRLGGREVFSDSNALELACDGVTVIVHLAAMNAQDCEKNPESALLVNGLNTLRLLQAAEKEGVRRFIYFSTAHIYGAPLEGVLTEESLPCPLHPYSITHRVAEDYVMEADWRGKLNGVIFRLTNAVGAPVSSDTNCWMLVVNDLCRQVVVDQQMRLTSDESILRDYIPISAVCSAVATLLDDDQLDGEIVNLSSGRALSLGQLTELVADRSEEVLGFRPNIIFNQQSKTTVSRPLEISNSKLKLHSVTIEKELSDEIDQLLVNCKQWFGKQG